MRACMDAGLVKGEGFAVDASVMEADASRYHGKAPAEIDWSAPERQTRAVAEFLTALDDEDSDAERKPPKVISPVDPCSAWTAKANKRVQFGYGLNYLIDIKYAVIVDVEATPARTYDEVAATKTMIMRTEQSLGASSPNGSPPTRPTALASSSIGLSAPGITPHIPCLGQEHAEEGILSRCGLYLDPGAQPLHLPSRVSFSGRPGRVGSDGRDHLFYRARTRDCGSCPLKPTVHSEYDLLERSRATCMRTHAMTTRALMGTPEFARSRNERKKVEMRFAHVKTHHGFERMRLIPAPEQHKSAYLLPENAVGRGVAFGI